MKRAVFDKLTFYDGLSLQSLQYRLRELGCSRKELEEQVSNAWKKTVVEIKKAHPHLDDGAVSRISYNIAVRECRKSFAGQYDAIVDLLYEDVDGDNFVNLDDVVNNAVKVYEQVNFNDNCLRYKTNNPEVDLKEFVLKISSAAQKAWKNMIYWFNVKGIENFAYNVRRSSEISSELYGSVINNNLLSCIFYYCLGGVVGSAEKIVEKLVKNDKSVKHALTVSKCDDASILDTVYGMQESLRKHCKIKYSEKQVEALKKSLLTKYSGGCDGNKKQA